MCTFGLFEMRLRAAWLRRATMLLAVVLATLLSCSPDRGAVEDAPSVALPTAAPASLAARRAAYVASVQARASAEYRAEALGGVMRAENPAQGFAAVFDTTGVHVAAVNGDSWNMTVRLEQYGCQPTLHAVDAPERGYNVSSRRISNNRVEYRHLALEPGGEVVEWYANGPLGLEQGFELAARPCPAGDAAGLVLDLGLDGNLLATVDHGGAVELRETSGRVAAHYGDLYVTDATGKELSARFSTGRRRITITIDDAGAVYPVRIDPLVWVQQGHSLYANTQSGGDLLGYSVAVSGNTVAVGGPHHDSTWGSVGIFVREGNTWGQQAMLFAADGESNTWFGASIGASGDTIVVGTPGGGGHGALPGAAYVFVRNGTRWSQQAKLVAPTARASAQFGSAVAVVGDTVIVGAPFQEGSSGAAYVFTRSRASWTLQAELLPTGAAADNLFGISVAIDGETVVVGAPASDTDIWHSGIAYVFSRNGTAWSLQAKLSAEDGAATDQFAYYVSISKETILVGSPLQEDRLANSGAAYAYVRSGTSWAQQAKIVAPDGSAGDQFGRIALSGDTAIVGAVHHRENGADSGAAYVSVRHGTAWGQPEKLHCAQVQAGDYFGFSVALEGETAVVGAINDDALGPDAGTAYVFVLRRGGADACDDGNQCASGFCADGVCCDHACDGPCDVCAKALGASSNGVCTNAAGYVGSPSCEPYVCGAASSDCPATCASDETCSSGYFCAGDAACTPAKADGDPCTTARQCASGFCTDGVCCGGACDGPCDVCAKSLGASADGICTNAAGYVGNPSCEPYVCGAASSDCPVACASDADCTSGHPCSWDGVCSSEEKRSYYSCAVASEGPGSGSSHVAVGALALTALWGRRRAKRRGRAQ